MSTGNSNNESLSLPYEHDFQRLNGNKNTAGRSMTFRRGILVSGRIKGRHLVTNQTINIQKRAAMKSIHHPEETDRFGGRIGVPHRQSTNIVDRTSISMVAR